MEDRQFSDGSVRMIDLAVKADGRITLDYRLVHPFPFVEDVKCEVTHTLNGRQISSSVTKLNETHQNPWVHRMEQPLKHVQGDVKILLKIGNTTKLEETVQVGATAAAPAVVALAQPAQRLVKALTSTPQGTPSFQATTVEERLPIMMKWITDRLDRGLLDTAWLGSDGGRGLDLDELALDPTAREDELWARRVAEMLLSLPYALPGTFYQRNETAIYKAMSERIEQNRDTFFPLTVQCQQTCSLALLTRGVPFQLLKPGCNAGQTEGLAIFKQAGAKWHKGDKFKSAKEALTASPPAGPATLFEFFSAVKGPNKGGAHIGFVLRTHTKGWFGLQTFDTGGLNAPGRAPVDLMQVAIGQLGGGIFCDPWVDRIRGTSEPFSGMGVIPSSFRPVPRLAEWWPLGFTRLIFRRRSDNKRLYATPLLWMHHKSESYAQARLAWSLVALPFADEIEAAWEIWIPRKAFVNLAMQAERTTPLREILQTANKPPDRPLRDVTTEILNSANVVGKPNGKVNVVKILSGDKNKSDTLPWGIRNKDEGTPPFPPFELVPEYLRGDETA